MKKDWEVKKLGEVYDVRDGTHDSPKYQKTGFALVTSKNLKRNEIILDDIQFISEEDYKNINQRSKVDKGDVLFAMIGTIGNPVVINIEPNFAIKNVALFKVPNNQSSYFLKYYLDSKSVIDRMTQEAKGTTQKFVGLSYLREFIIPLPPLPTQQHIVAILDEAFDAIAKAKENTEKNLKNAREVFDSYLNSIFANPKEDWVEKRLGEICKFVRGPFGGSLKKIIFKKEGYAVYEQMHAIYGNFDNVRYFIDKEKFKEMERFELHSGELLMSCSGTMGKVVIVPEHIKSGVINQALLKLTTKKEINNIFLKYWMESKGFQNRLKTFSQGAAIQNITSVAVLKAINITIPSISTQQAIVAKLDELSTETKRLEVVYQKKLEDLEELKKSLLQKAFNGELTD